MKRSACSSVRGPNAAGVCFLAGFLAGAWAFHFWTAKGFLAISGAPAAAGSSGPAAPPGSVFEAEVGKAIIATDEKHAGDSMWVSTSATAEICNQGAMVPDAMLCRIAYLVRHATGEDMDRGPRGEWVALKDVADFCDEGAIEKSSNFALRHTQSVTRR